MSELLFSTSPLKPHERANWLNDTTQKVSERFKLKYLRGSIEHGGDLGQLELSSLLAEIEAEALDQLSYVHEVKRRLDDNQVLVTTLTKIILGLQQGATLANSDLDTIKELKQQLSLQGYRYP
jgi:hypothetical protein